MSPIRILRTVIASVAVAATVVAATAAPAQAQQQEVHLNCTLAAFATLDPPITFALEPQEFEVDIAGDLAQCIPVSEAAEGLESAELVATGTGETTLCVLATSTGTGELTWNDETTSEFDYDFNLNILNPQAGLLLTLTITSGTLAGSTAVVAFVPIATGDCVITPMSGFGLFNATATFIEL